jgi:hypothetical protein
VKKNVSEWNDRTYAEKGLGGVENLLDVLEDLPARQYHRHRERCVY